MNDDYEHRQLFEPGPIIKEHFDLQMVTGITASEAEQNLRLWAEQIRKLSIRLPEGLVKDPIKPDVLIPPP